ncbi:hypothetical protein KKG38_00020 [Patescibacteria group bacterium]|nr:hypothetical protein [Patescibacteria group bacterium]MBU1901650.1 hypothetical protein [Patescibacteria group bacterium]
MSEVLFHKTKKSVLNHIEMIFQEIEESIMMTHQEKYTLLEDAFENANDVDELRIAFDHWYIDHAEDLDLEEDADELWGMATSLMDDGDFEESDDEDDDEDSDDEDDDI